MFTIAELETLTGVRRATIRYYRTRGLLPPPTPRRGPHARYPALAARRLRSIREAKDARATLADLAERFAAHPCG
ncbi:MAG: helix-turn-helix domain-containing protein [Pseudomonadota bacterium]|nr:helix-turn-helix domain-containing protein [Pseudomonadota bacterium]